MITNTQSKLILPDNNSTITFLFQVWEWVSQIYLSFEGSRSFWLQYDSICPHNQISTYINFASPSLL